LYQLSASGKLELSKRIGNNHGFDPVITSNEEYIFVYVVNVIGDIHQHQVWAFNNPLEKVQEFHFDEEILDLTANICIY
jgi:hypothetical protein